MYEGMGGAGRKHIHDFSYFYEQISGKNQPKEGVGAILAHSLKVQSVFVNFVNLKQSRMA